MDGVSVDSARFPLASPLAVLEDADTIAALDVAVALEFAVALTSESVDQG